jgi:hypothetical protein
MQLSGYQKCSEMVFGGKEAAALTEKSMHEVFRSVDSCETQNDLQALSDRDSVSLAELGVTQFCSIEPEAL